MIDWAQHITSNPEISFGKPVIKNTRIPVYLILEKLASGDTMDDLLQAYPELSKNDITACLLFAADNIKKSDKADFMKLVRRIRSKVGKNPPTLKEITLEVEKVRTKRYKESASK